MGFLKKFLIIILMIMFILPLPLLNVSGVPITKQKEEKAQAQITKATKIANEIENMVTQEGFDPNVAQKQLELAIKEVSKILLYGNAYSKTYSAYQNRIARIEMSIAKQKEALAPAQDQIIKATKIVTEIENMVIQDNFDPYAVQQQLEIAVAEVSKILQYGSAYSKICEDLQLRNAKLNEVINNRNLEIKLEKLLDAGIASISTGAIAVISNMALICNGEFNIATRIEFQENGYGEVAARDASDGTELKETVFQIKQLSKVTYKINKQIDNCTLTVKDINDGKEIIKYSLKNNIVPMELSKGKYLYVFNMDWKNGHAVYEQPIEIN